MLIVLKPPPVWAIHNIYVDAPVDEDEYTPVPVDYSKSIERAKQKSAREIERIAGLEELQNRAVSAERYSYLWFKTLLEMECKNYGEISSGSKEVSINFGKVEKEIGTKRTMILRNPSRYIPQFMEDLADIPLVLHFGDKTKTLAIEVANIQSHTLRVKLKSHAEIEGIDLSTVTSANIDAQSPSFLLEELKEKFFALEFDDDYNMRDNLCKNIEFVFGPPGTGKTTHIAKNFLMPMMQGYKPCRVLVLTPTNKAADVIVHRIMELSGTNRAYENWLIRFGATSDEFIEESPVFRDKTFDITSKSKSVTVTTIARFPYDFFMPLGKRLFLDGINWDYIIVDEASMISLAYIIYPLFKKTPTKFIVAGDPFQIEPITSIDLWKNENIYTMVKLNKKNIINVSISRAKDYLFVIMPDNDTDNVQNLRLLKQVERLIKSSADWKEYSSSDLERIMFGNDKYLEENAFSTGHQSVNVYGLPEMRYEIRTEDAAVDVQIHKGVHPKENVSPVIIQEEPNPGTQLSIKVKGRFTGEYALVCYEGKLRKATDKATVNYFIPIESGTKYKLIPVAVAKESREIFIAENSYQKYSDAIISMDEVEIRKTYLS